MMKKELSAYMTLEATLIMPFAIALNILIIYFGFFLYNQCIVSQSCYLAALRGSQIKNCSDTQIQEITERELEKLLKEQIFTSGFQHNVEVNTFSIKTSAASQIKILFQKLHLYEEEMLVADSKNEIVRLDAVAFIRKSRLIK